MTEIQPLAYDGEKIVVDPMGQIVEGLDTAIAMWAFLGFITAAAVTWQSIEPRWAQGQTRFKFENPWAGFGIITTEGSGE